MRRSAATAVAAGTLAPARRRETAAATYCKQAARSESAASALGGRSLPAGNVQRHGRADERLQGRRVDLLVLVDVDGSSHVSIEAGVEEPGGVLQGGALGERHLHDALVCLT